MRKLNEQWIEVIDGQEHMMKAVAKQSSYNCLGCSFASHDGGYRPTQKEPEFQCKYYAMVQKLNTCDFGATFIVKDLGILRLRDGVLPCPFCGEYPEVSYTDEYVEISCENMECKIASMTPEDKTLQQAIDAWNRRL